jgi:hypothetical protein
MGPLVEMTEWVIDLRTPDPKLNKKRVEKEISGIKAHSFTI